MKRQDGFSLIELMVAMTVFIMAMAAVSNVFLTLFSLFKQQTKIAESSIENVVGFEISRRDIEVAGSGLPWIIPATVAYSEAVGAIAAVYNDSPSNPPRGIAGGNNLVGLLNSSDYLVVKAVNAASDDVAQRWALLDSNNVTRNGLSGDPFDAGDNVVIIYPGTNAGNAHTLIVAPGGVFSTTYDTTLAFVPAENEINVIYGLDADNASMPFNRVDYYLSAANTPSRCAPGTGVLVKAEVSQTDGTLSELPLIDCVADFQVVYRLDTDGDGLVETTTENITGVLTTAQLVRDQLKEVRIYILSHEGQRDTSYVHPSSSIDVGEQIPAGGVYYGTDDFDLTGLTADWDDYRWKVHTQVMRLGSLQ